MIEETTTLTGHQLGLMRVHKGDILMTADTFRKSGASHSATMKSRLWMLAGFLGTPPTSPPAQTKCPLTRAGKSGR